MQDPGDCLYILRLEICISPDIMPDNSFELLLKRKSRVLLEKWG